MTGQQEFQSTLSARRATDYRNVLRYYYLLFQSTLSARRATAVCGRRPIFFFCISIHALREESDYNPLGGARGAYYFNPRSPRGERPQKCNANAGGKYHFNPRSPRGERHISNLLRIRTQYFNPRSPRGERLFFPLLSTINPFISIHALREESDGQAYP